MVFQKQEDITKLTSDVSRLQTELDNSKDEFERLKKEQNDKNESLGSEIKVKNEKADELDK